MRQPTTAAANAGSADRSLPDHLPREQRELLSRLEQFFVTPQYQRLLAAVVRKRSLTALWRGGGVVSKIG